MKLLWLKAGGLYPLDSGGKLRTHNILNYLASSHQVTFVSYYRMNGTAAACDPALRHRLDRVIEINSAEPPRFSTGFYWAYLKSFFSATPFQMQRFHDGAVASRIRDLIAGDQFDLAVCDFLSPVLNVPTVKSCPWVLFAHNVETQIWDLRRRCDSSLFGRLIAQIEFHKMRAFEQKQALRFDYIWTVSQQDASHFACEFPANRIHVVRTAVDAAFFQPETVDRKLRALVFVGSLDWWPNHDAMVYFCRETLPRIRAQVPEVELWIVGRNAGAELLDLARRHQVTLASSVEDVRPYLHRGAIFVVPLRVGGGTRLKIYEAMAAGLPVVSTAIGAEGLEVENGVNILLADHPADFASACLRLLHDPGLGHSLAQNALHQVRQHHTWEIVGRELCDFLEQHIGGREVLSNPVPT